MAVFTKLNKIDIEKLLINYNIGKLIDFSEIIEGIENTNYKIICESNTYILTIFEKRINQDDLPFFMNLKLYLNDNDFECPRPIKNKNNNVISTIKNKKAVIVSFIEGNNVHLPNTSHCFKIGKMIGRLHDITKNFGEKKNNILDFLELKKIFLKSKNTDDEIFKEIFNTLESEIQFLEKSWPKKLPSGIIHADLFKDNIFFSEEEISGVIDFYFSCYHFLLYDIAIVVNDWCFENNGKNFNTSFFKSIIEGYSLSRSLNENEMNALNIVLRIAAVRILVTRLHDYIFHPNGAKVLKKDPFQYLKILKWHQKNTLDIL